MITHIPETTVNIQIHKIDEQKYAIPLEIADEIGDFKDGDNLTIRIQLLKLERNSKIIAEYDMMSNEMVQELPIPSPLVKEIP